MADRLNPDRSHGWYTVEAFCQRRLGRPVEVNELAWPWKSFAPLGDQRIRERLAREKDQPQRGQMNVGAAVEQNGLRHRRDDVEDRHPFHLKPGEHGTRIEFALVRGQAKRRPVG